MPGLVPGMMFLETVIASEAKQSRGDTHRN
jgi:hypothetical protein